MHPLVAGYDELRLRIDRQQAGGYRVFASTRDAEASRNFELPFSDLELENFILRVSRPRGRRRVNTSAMDEARRIGGGLFTALFDGEVHALYRDTRAQARLRGRGVRITLCLSGSPDLIDVPWEYLFDEPDFLAMSAFTPVVRYLDLPRAHRPLLVTSPLRVLGVVSNPSEYEQLDVERERANLTRALAEVIDAGVVELRWLDRPTLGSLLRALQTETFHALHYIGHGTYDHDADRGVLLFEDETGWARAVSGDKLGMVLHDFSSLRLAVLNACEGARTSRADPFAGVAGSLVQRDIPAVVAMQFEISDEAAIVFAGGFYTPLAAGAPVDASLAGARLAMLAERSDDIEWGTPALFMRVPDGRIFELGKPPGAAAARTVVRTGGAADTAGPGRERGRRVLAGSAVTALVAAGVGAAVLLDGGSSAASRASTATAPPFTIVYQPPWRPATRPATGTFALRREPGDPTGPRSGIAELTRGPAMLAAGALMLSDRIPGGPPPALVKRYGRPTISAAAQVARDPGRRYTWSTTDTVVVAYVLALRTGDGAIICAAPPPAAVTLSTCGAAATIARTAAGAQTLPPGPDQQLARAARGAMAPVVSARAGMTHARGALPARVRAAEAVARTESRAIARLRRLAPPSRYQPPLTRLATALTAEAASFTTLARAARSSDRALYARDVASVTSASRGVSAADRELGSYRLGLPLLGALRLAGPPPVAATSPLSASSSTETTPARSSSTTPYTPPPPSVVSSTTTTPFS
ncbi:MAG TPA: CHAT domain-containing protein [Solirubrobacteraceae bacterium]